MHLTEPANKQSAAVIALAENEKALIALACRQDQSAFHKLYEMHFRRVYALCFRLTGQSSMAEEATQEVFLRVWTKLDSFTGDSSFSTWLHSVATNTTLSYLRKQKNWLQMMKLRIDNLTDTEVQKDPADQLPAGHSTEISRLDKLLPRLPERARVVFVLHALEGYRHEQIGKALRITEGACKAHFHRARTLITELLEAEA